MRNTRLPEALHYQLLLREPLVAVVPQGHPLAETPGGALRFQHLAQEPFVFSRAKWAPRCTTKFCCCSARPA
ncbi:LysR substrate-binding domain-containing protein [Serratia ureilytica]